MTDQRQKVGDNSVVVQSGRDTVIQAGIGREEMQNIIETLAQQQTQYAAVAREIVDARLVDLEQRLIEKFTTPGQANTGAFKDPDFQYLLTRAQHAYARSGDKQVADTLVDIIAERSKLSKRDRLMMALNAAVDVAPTLTANEFAELSLVFLIRYTAIHGQVSLDGFKQYFQKTIAPLLPDIATTRSSYQYLEGQRCSSIEISSISVQKAFHSNYGGLICKGFTLENLKKHLPDDKKHILDGSPLLIPCLHDPSRLQFRALTGEEALDQLKNFDLEEEQRNNVVSVFKGAFMSLEEIKTALIPLIPKFGTFTDLWDSTLLKNLTLTSIGIAIAHSNLRRLCGFEADLSIWID